MKTCYIFGAADGLPDRFKKNEEDLVIAADSGINHLEKFGALPDIAVGDFDSLGFVPDCGEVIRHPVMKDDTDTMLAVKTGFERGYDRFIIYGGVGGRPDHTFANYQTLCYISRRGGRGYLCFNGYTACCITDGEMNFPAREGTLSVFAMSGKAEGVTLRGVLYPLESTVLSYDFPLGVSNEFTGKPATVSVKKGTLLVIWQGSADAPE